MLPKCSMYGIFTHMNGLNSLYSYLTNTTPFSTSMSVAARVVYMVCFSFCAVRHVIQEFQGKHRWNM